MPTRHHRSIALAIAAACALALALATAAGQPSGSDSISAMSADVEPEFRPESPQPVEGITETTISPDSPLARTVASALPGQPDVISVLERVDTRTAQGVDSVKVSTVVDWRGYEVTIFRTFSPAELTGLPTSESEAGRSWIAATDRDLTSIYYLSGSGIGLRIAHLDPEAPASAMQLVSIAAALASDAVVLEEAAK